MKKACSILLASVFIFALAGSAIPAAAAGGMDHFQKTQDYTEQFSDVDSSAWYYSDVASAYEYGLIAGTDGKYNPMGNVSIAEAVTFAARIRCIYFGDERSLLNPGKGAAWYTGSIAYLQNAGIDLSCFTGRYTAAATRIEVAYLFDQALPSDELPVINDQIAAVPDVLRSDSRASDVLALYRAGITTGSDKYGSFQPASQITRAEVTAMAGRMIQPEKRRRFAPATKPVKVSPAQVTVFSGIEQPLTATPQSAFYCPVKTVWVSENPDIATVDLFGYVLGKKAGITNVSLQSADGEHLGQASVTVKALPVEAGVYDNCVRSEVWLFTYDTHGDMVNRSLGVLVSREGTIITTCDAIRGAQNIAAFFKDRVRQAFVLVYDEKRNLAVLKISAKLSPDFRWRSHYRSEDSLKPFDNFVSVASAKPKDGDILYALSIADVSAAYYFNLKTVSYLMPGFAECTVVGTNADGLLKLKAGNEIPIDGTMLFTAEGKLAAVLRAGGYLKDTTYVYASLVTATDASPSSSALYENVIKKLIAGTYAEGQYVCNELESAISANMYFGVMRGRTMVATLQNVDDEDSFMMIDKTGDINVLLRTECLPKGAVEMKLVNKYGKIVAQAVQTKEGLRLHSTLTGNAPCFLVVAVGEKIKSGAYILCSDRYTLYFS